MFSNELDNYVNYLNSIIDMSNDPREFQYAENILYDKCMSNIYFYIYTSLYKENTFIVNKVNYSIKSQGICFPFTNEFYLNQNRSFDGKFSYEYSYKVYNIKENFYIDNLKNITTRIFALMFTFNATDVPINISKVVKEIFKFCYTTETSIKLFIDTIDQVFYNMIDKRSDSMEYMYNTDINTTLPVVSKTFVLKEYKNIIDLLNNCIVNYEDSDAILNVINTKIYKIKQLVNTYLNYMDQEYMFRQYLISAIARFINTYIYNNLLSSDDLLAYIIIDNVLLLCSKLKPDIISMFDYNYANGYI